MVPVRTQTPNEPSLGADAHVLLGLALTPRASARGVDRGWSSRVLFKNA
jgi:hypothetical protein